MRAKRTIGPIEQKIIWGFRVLFAVGFVVVLYAFWIEPSRLIVRHHDVYLGERWPHELDGVKVAVLSDLHVGSPYNGIDKFPRVISAIRAETPDLMLLLGDYQITDVWGGTYVPPGPTAKELAKVAPPLGAFAVLGNHDWWEGGPRTIAAFTENNITILDNASAPVNHNGMTFWIVGLADDTTQSPDYVLATENVPKGAIKLAITHDPAAYMELEPDHGAALLLAGHMHGGQVYLPWLFDPITPGRAPSDWAYGFIDVNGTPLYVSAGVGTSIYPVRLNQPPEIVIMTLKSGDMRRTDD